MELPTTITLSLILLLQAGCGLLGSDPKEPELEPGRRDYVWQVDTLYSPPGGFVYDIWGSSPNDVWAVLGTGVNNLWHYDGSEWRVWPKRVAASFYSIYGLAQDDVWMGSSDGKIFHFDGEEWGLSYTYEALEVRYIDIVNIWGNSPSDIYLVGSGFLESEQTLVSFILHYDGKQWQELYMSNNNLQFLQVRIEDNTPLILGYKTANDGNDTTIVFKYENKTLSDIILRSKNEVRGLSINNIGNTVYCYFETTILDFDKGNFKLKFNFPSIEDVIRVDGRHEKDLFIHSWDTTFHYNGTDIEPILEDLPRSVLRSVVFENEVFFVIRDYNNGTNLIYHGTLPNEQEEGI